LVIFVIVVVGIELVERRVLCERESVEYKSLLDCKIFSWVRRSTLQLGAQGGERKRGEERRSAS
jgi:hypothetical protein